MKTRGASGEVLAFGVKSDVQYVQIKTEKGLRVITFPKGEHKALSVGQNLKTGGLVTDEHGYKTKEGKILKQYNWVGEQSQKSDQTYVPSNPQSDVTKVIPDSSPITVGVEDMSTAIYITSKAAELVKEQVPDLLALDTKEFNSKVLPIAVKLMSCAQVLMDKTNKIIEETFLTK